MNGAGKKVAVTGASGFIASWLVKLLLERGYTVNASVRDPSDPKKTEHLLLLEGAKDRLHLFGATLLEEGSFDTLVDGCDAVFHTASPVIFTTNNPQEDLIDPAFNGTLNLLRSCKNVKSIKRVILTSSVASVIFNEELKPGVVVDETWFSDSTFCVEKKLWYPLSKTLAEEAAWKYCKDNGMDLVTIHPGTVWGPMVHPSVNPSLGMMLQLVNGTETYPDRTVKAVDVRDVAYAHILAFEVQSASGRYLLVGSSAHFYEILNTLGRLFPTIQLPNRSVLSPLALPNHTILNEKTNDLGVKFIPLEKTLKDTIESFKEKNLITF